LIALIQGEPGGSVVDSLRKDPASTCLVHAINLCEVYYLIIRMVGVVTADQAISDLITVGLLVREDMDWAFCKEVGVRKAHGRIALPDCFCLTLAIQLGGRVVTSDHKEFDPLVPLGLCPILFIR
jgi:predicted nucleic acid-binding protein